MSLKDYTRQGDFTADESNNKAGRSLQDSSTLDSEFDQIKLVLDDAKRLLDKVLRSDEKILDNVLEGHEFSNAAISVLKGKIGNSNAALTWRSSWAQNTSYEVGDLAYDSITSDIFYCLVAHNSGTTYTSLSNYIAANPNQWELFIPGSSTSFPASPSADDVLLRDTSNTTEVWGKIKAANTDGSFAPKNNAALTGTTTLQASTQTGKHTTTGSIVRPPATATTPTTDYTVDFASRFIDVIDLSSAAAVTITSSNLEDGAMKEVYIKARSGVDVSITWPAGWTFMGYKPPSVLDGKNGYLTLRCLGGNTDSDVVAFWTEAL